MITVEVFILTFLSVQITINIALKTRPSDYVCAIIFIPNSAIWTWSGLKNLTFWL